MPGYAKPPPVNASSIAYSPTGNVAATNIQNAITELDLEKSYGFRNAVINGGFAIDQRNSGASQTITAGAALAYTVDRWYAYCTGANITGARVAGAAPSRYYYRFTGAASNTGVGFGQRIETDNSFHLAGNTVTLSVNIASTSLTSITWTAFYANTTDTFGTLASPTRTQIATGTFTVSSTLARKTTSIEIPAAATTGIEIVFTGGALLGSQTLTFDDAQLELGSIATPFEQRPIGTELALCQRYYYRMLQEGSATRLAFGSNISAVEWNSYPIPLPATMRATPTQLGSGTGAISNGTTYEFTGVNLSGVTVYNLVSSPTNIVLRATSLSGMTAFRPTWLEMYSGTGYLAFSAEL